MPQGAHRFDPRRTPRRDGAGAERNERECAHRANQHHGIGVLELEQQGPRHPTESDRQNQADGPSDERHAANLSHHHATDPAAVGTGLGGRLMAGLIERCTGLGYRQMVAVIGDSPDEGSIGFHRRLGFESTGVIRSAGFKFGHWTDVVIMSRPLGPGDATPPEG